MPLIALIAVFDDTRYFVVKNMLWKLVVFDRLRKENFTILTTQ